MADRRTVTVGRHAVVLIDSVTQIIPGDAGAIVVTGSHGGASAAGYALSVDAALYVFNDAGIGRDEAGVAGLAMLEEAGIAACAVGHMTARIGEAADTLERGTISRANGLAAAAGFLPGTALRQAIAGFAA
jgi:hypothetical protein